MTIKNYLMLCGAGAVLTVLAMLFVPGVADAFEGVVLLFLSTNAT